MKFRLRVFAGAILATATPAFAASEETVKPVQLEFARHIEQDILGDEEDPLITVVKGQSGQPGYFKVSRYISGITYTRKCFSMVEAPDVYSNEGLSEVPKSYGIDWAKIENVKVENGLVTFTAEQIAPGEKVSFDILYGTPDLIAATMNKLIALCK